MRFLVLLFLRYMEFIFFFYFYCSMYLNVCIISEHEAFKRYIRFSSNLVDTSHVTIVKSLAIFDNVLQFQCIHLIKNSYVLWPIDSNYLKCFLDNDFFLKRGMYMRIKMHIRHGHLKKKGM